MSARDIFHDAVRRGLEKEQWQISSDPLELRWEEVRVKIDLAAERLISAERGEEKIAVEIKSFISPSPVSDFHTALVPLRGIQNAKFKVKNWVVH